MHRIVELIALPVLHRRRMGRFFSREVEENRPFGRFGRWRLPTDRFFWGGHPSNTPESGPKPDMRELWTVDCDRPTQDITYPRPHGRPHPGRTIHSPRLTVNINHPLRLLRTYCFRRPRRD